MYSSVVLKQAKQPCRKPFYLKAVLSTAVRWIIRILFRITVKLSWSVRISVASTILYAEHKGHKINIIDAPGFDDFIGEVVAALNVADTAFMVINGQNGVEVGTEINFRQTNANNTPLVFLINHLEHEKSSFDESMRRCKTGAGNAV